MTALSVADFGGSSGAGQNEEDGDLDLFIGRPASSGSYFFQAQADDGMDAPTNQWLKVRLGPYPTDPYETPSYGFGNNALGIGSQVTVQIPASGTPSWQQVQIVDGGSGLGGQRSSELTFGLGEMGSDAKITVVWPDGYTQERVVQAVGFNATEEFFDDHTPEIVMSTMIFGQIPMPNGTTDWEFLWQTENSCVPDSSQVWVEYDPSSSGGKGDPCDLDPSDPTIGGVWLSSTRGDVSVTVTPTVNGRYQHKLRWFGRICESRCGYLWRAHSEVTENRDETTSLQPASVPMCMN